MPNCAANGCTNTSKKKFKMNSFPRNPIQRAIWVKNIDRKDWIPNNNAALCEDHFAPNMWEKTRVDGSRKLRRNAVPTIFGDNVIEESTVQVQTAKSSNKIKTKVLNNISMKSINNQTVLKLIPSTNTMNLQPTSIVIPVASNLGTQSINPLSAIIVNNKSQIINSNISSNISKGTSILKPEIKAMKGQSPFFSPIITSPNGNVQIRHIKTAASQASIIPAATSILKPQVLTINSQQVPVNFKNITQVNPTNAPSIVPATSVLKPLVHSNNFHFSSENRRNISQGKFVNIQPKLVPVTNNTIESSTSQLTTNSTIDFITSKIENDDSMDSKSLEVNDVTCEKKSQPITLVSKPTGIILNKTEAKKMEEERFEKMDKLLLKQLKLNNALRKKLNLMNHKVHQYMKEKNSDYKAFLKEVFTEDQIRVLELRHINPKSITAWSCKTMMKAIKLKQECGTRGYEELLNQNLPLPSMRTISRWCTSRNIPIP